MNRFFTSKSSASSSSAVQPALGSASASSSSAVQPAMLNSLDNVRLLGKDQKEELQSGLAGNHVLVTQAQPTKTPMLPPTAEELSENFVAVFCKSVDELEKSQILKVSREDYKILARE